MGRPRAQAASGGDLQGVQRPQFEDKLIDVVGLYLSPPKKVRGVMDNETLIG
jgi:hypothetical protein